MRRSLDARLDALTAQQQQRAGTATAGRRLSMAAFAAAMAELTAGCPPEQAADLKRRTLAAYRAIEPPSAENPLGLSKLTDEQLDLAERLAQHLERKRAP